MSDNANTRRPEHRSYLVFDEELLYRLADAKLLHHLNGATISKKDGTTRLYYFDKDEEVGQYIDEWKAERRESY